ncbi:MAG: DUF3987 domain-containing protein, partial [Coleofasciculus sp. S288]|nr:DUF3987 domain-containing protein [Coleofasciculus sp. S288]
MVNTSINPCAASERQIVIDWLTSHNYPALPVAPVQDARQYPKVVTACAKLGRWDHCPLSADLKPIPLFTGKNPSYLDKNGIPHLVNHRQYQHRLPSKKELDLWFAHPSNGIGTLGGWNDTVWLDFDVKKFSSQSECDTAVQSILSRIRHSFGETYLERSHSGGWRIGIKVQQKPDFTNFSLTPNGSHVGEALFEGRFTVLAPTIGPSGNPYQSIVRTQPINVKNLESMGIYATGKQHTQRQRKQTIPGSLPLEQLASQKATDILQGHCPTGDRSEALATAIQEWYGWENWTRANGILVSGTTEALAYQAGHTLGLDSDRIHRIIEGIDPTGCEPAAQYRGGEESCWKKIRRLSQTTYERHCPTYIKSKLACSQRSVVSGNVKKDPIINKQELFRKIKEILLLDLPPAELQLCKILLRAENRQISERELSQLFEALDREIELSESRNSRRAEVDNLLKLGDQSLNLREFLPAELADPLENLGVSLSIRPEVCLTSLLVATSSVHKIGTELVIHRGIGFSVPPGIYSGLVAESGQKKSPVLKAIIRKPLSILQKEKRDAFSQTNADYEKNIVEWDKCRSHNRQSKFPNGKPKKPEQLLYYFTSSTGEGILYQFQAHPHKPLLALVDELAGLFASQNKYTMGRGSDRQEILSAFDGTGATVLRASGTRADIDKISLSIFGTIQPEVLRRLMKDCSDPDGHWARFLFVNQPLSASTLPKADGKSIDLTKLLLKYYRTIDRLPVLEYRLSPEAFTRYQPVYNQLEQLRVSHPNPGMRAVYSKMEGYIGRLALNLHVLHELATGKTVPAEEIPLAIMEKAIALAKFYIGQVMLVHANCATDLSDLAPHLAKIVALSKRMDSTTGNPWIKAKVVQSGYDSRHRPRPDSIRSWFRELEALGIGTTRGAGIRLEYSWKLPDSPFDDSDPPPTSKEDNQKTKGEKWIPSKQPETLQNQCFTEILEDVDTSAHQFELDWSEFDVELRDDAQLQKVTLPDEYALSSQPPISNPTSFETEPIASVLDNKTSSSQSSLEEELSIPSPNSQRLTSSNSPLSGCNDGIAPTEVVDAQSKISPLVEALSTGSQPTDVITEALSTG